jgi:hypothetical protein
MSQKGAEVKHLPKLLKSAIVVIVAGGSVFAGAPSAQAWTFTRTTCYAYVKHIITYDGATNVPIRVDVIEVVSC